MLHMNLCGKNDSSFLAYLSKESAEMDCSYGELMHYFLLCADLEHGESSALL